MRRLIIHGSNLGGWALPIGFGAIVFALVVTELLKPIETLRSLFTWLGLAVFLALVLIGAELAARRNFVEVSDDHIRWSFMQPPERGDEHLADLVDVEVWPKTGAQLLFKTRKTVVSLADFPRWRINRLVETLRGLGAQGVEKD